MWKFYSIEFKTSSFFREILDQFLIDIPRQWIEFEDVYYEGKCVVSEQILKDKILGRPETPLRFFMTKRQIAYLPHNAV